MSKVCVIIPTFNRAQYIIETIESVLNQTVKPDEILVINDGSTDNTISVLEPYNDKISLINKENSGKAESLNIALQNTSAEFIWIVDDDDLTTEDALETLLKLFDANPDNGFVFANFERFRTENNEFITEKTQHDVSWAFKDPSIGFLRAMFTRQGTMLVKRSALIDIGMFDTKLIRSQDYDMVLKLLKDHKCTGIDKVIFYQRMHDGVRGSAKHSISYSDVIKRWYDYDKIIYEWVRRNYKFENFTPLFAYKLDEKEKKRATQIQKIAIFSNHGMWNYVIDDLQELSTFQANNLSSLEIDTLRNYVTKHLAIEELFSDIETVVKLQKIRKSNKIARDVIWHITRQLVWNAKNAIQKKDFAKSVSNLWLFVKINMI